LEKIGYFQMFFSSGAEEVSFSPGWNFMPFSSKTRDWYISAKWDSTISIDLAAEGL